MCAFVFNKLIIQSEIKERKEELASEGWTGGDTMSRWGPQLVVATRCRGDLWMLDGPGSYPLEVVFFFWGGWAVLWQHEKLPDQTSNLRHSCDNASSLQRHQEPPWGLIKPSPRGQSSRPPLEKNLLSATYSSSGKCWTLWWWNLSCSMPDY